MMKSFKDADSKAKGLKTHGTNLEFWKSIISELAEIFRVDKFEGDWYEILGLQTLK